MADQIKGMCGTYLRAFLSILLALMATIGGSPLDFTSADWRMLANGLWASFLPVIMRSLSTNTHDYGRAPKK